MIKIYKQGEGKAVLDALLNRLDESREKTTREYEKLKRKFDYEKSLLMLEAKNNAETIWQQIREELGRAPDHIHFDTDSRELLIMDNSEAFQKHLEREHPEIAATLKKLPELSKVLKGLVPEEGTETRVVECESLEDAQRVLDRLKQEEKETKEKMPQA